MYNLCQLLLSSQKTTCTTKIIHRKKFYVKTYKENILYPTFCKKRKEWYTQQKIHKKGPIDLAKAIQEDIYNLTEITSTVGIGQNILMAKLALDNGAKKSPDEIAKWKYEHISTKVWSIEPLDGFWRKASKTKMKLNRLGITNIGELARYPKEVLIKQLGNVMGTELHLHSNGIDFSIYPIPPHYNSLLNSLTFMLNV